MVKHWLEKTSNFKFTSYILIAAFGVYFCMYAYRKPYMATSYDNKEILVIAQVIGYLLSKFIGIHFISELTGQKRAYLILYLIGFAQLNLFAFAYWPASWRSFDFVLLFLNGLPLGLVWGIVFSYLEGRKLTDILSAGLTVSFIISSGFVKSMGKLLMVDWQFSAYQMPWMTGVVFAPFTIFFVWMLAQIPPPPKEDQDLKQQRNPMNGENRRQFILTYWPGLLMLVVAYMLFTGLRDMRENFANEIWSQLGYTNPAVFTKSELPVGLIIGIVMSAFFVLKDNLKALMFYHILILSGLFICCMASLIYSIGWINPMIWMILVGIGTYMAYVTFACVLFDRLMASSPFIGNAGFMIYVADSMGYMGSVTIMLIKKMGLTNFNWLEVFKTSTIAIPIIGIFLMLGSLTYFHLKFRKHKKQKIA